MTISTGQISQPMAPPIQTQAPQTPLGIEDLDTKKKVGGQTPPRPAGGLSQGAGAGAIHYGAPDLDGIDWEALANDLSTTDTVSISISDIMILMITTMADMRQAQRDAWMADAQNALAMGLNAADRMRESAAAKLACDVISNGASIITAAISLGMSIGSAVKMHNVMNSVKLEANAMLKAELPPVNTPPPAASPTVQANSLQVQTQALQDLKSDTPTLGADTLKSPAPGTTPSPTAAETPAPKSVEPGVKAQDGGTKTPNQWEVRRWETKEIHNQMEAWNAKTEIATKVSDIVGALMKTGGAVGEYFSGTKQAEAQEARARGDFYNTIANTEMDFANELRDAMRSALDAMKNVESSRHQAMQGIYNI